MHRLNPECSIEILNERCPGTLPGWYGIKVVSLEAGLLVAEMEIRPEMLAPNGFLHAASVIALADTCAGFATIAHLPPGASNFTTVELKTNFLGTQTEGALRCVASAVHTGRTTQVWDAEVTGAGGRKLALFRCTQMILWPKAA
ncbi:MAG: PaaI family thioesterase [Rhodocyclaceae bacterium]|nr:PaaI family thioesterase [Rhodocyclaceae bacterium]MCP5240359.1 PaaI family thioesterase [Zoogloeaceae bacterium]MCB1910391.1 PaaI family thioesterase [Rhodocyclaceae bacterium]MCP5253532.1 PaaI family thioesterase [Zoogloeaceae bacterium]MCP5294933.1 PaaI family thioesterase [Zoogloeaceae bacterium]